MLSLEEFRRVITYRGLVLSDDPPHFESFVQTPWGTRIPAAVRVDRATQAGQVDYLRWLEEVLDEVAGRKDELPWERSGPTKTKGGNCDEAAATVEHA